MGFLEDGAELLVGEAEGGLRLLGFAGLDEGFQGVAVVFEEIAGGRDEEQGQGWTVGFADWEMFSLVLDQIEDAVVSSLLALRTSRFIVPVPSSWSSR